MRLYRRTGPVTRAARRGWTFSSWSGCAVLVVGSTRSFPGGQERGVGGGGGSWVRLTVQLQCLSTDGFCWWPWCCRSRGPATKTHFFNVRHRSQVRTRLYCSFFIVFIFFKYLLKIPKKFSRTRRDTRRCEVSIVQITGGTSGGSVTFN